jgi:phosphoribosylanthranilate isomerase
VTQQDTVVVGKKFNWEILDSLIDMYGMKWVLSGGLNIKNIKNVVKKFCPPCVDVSSGVEENKNGEIQKGKKDKLKIYKFVQAVNSANKVG